MSPKKILICCQEVDKKSATLGFFHKWILELSKNYEQVTVVALKVGEYDFLENTKVYSLGKVKETDSFFVKINYIFNFYFYIIQNLKNYDSVFIHQSQEYAILGGPIWKLFSKKTYLWRNHYAGNFLTKLACKFMDKTFFTSKSSYNARFKNAIQMPVGVDVDSLITGDKIERAANSILSLARLDPSKKPEIILKALANLQNGKVNFTTSFVGGTSKDKFPNYEQEIFKLKKDLNLSENVKFIGPVPSGETYKYYLSHEIYVNVAKSGMLDKTIFKALAAGCLPLTTSADFNEMLAPVLGEVLKVEQDSSDSLAEKLKFALALPKGELMEMVKKAKNEIIEKQSLEKLVAQLKTIL